MGQDFLPGGYPGQSLPVALKPKNMKNNNSKNQTKPGQWGTAMMPMLTKNQMKPGQQGTATMLMLMLMLDAVLIDIPPTFKTPPRSPKTVEN